MRIWHQSFTDLEMVPTYERSLIEHSGKVVSSDTEVTVHGLRPGTYGTQFSPIDAIRHRYLEFVNGAQICEAALAAEAAGYDGFALGCFFDPALTEARTLVTIPVVGIAETCMTVACTLGERFAMVALNEDQRYHYEDVVRNYGLRERCAGVIAMSPGIDEYSLETEGEEMHEIAASFHRACEAAMAAGAEVIIPSDGVLNEFVWRHGLLEHGGATVMDSIGVLFRYTEFVVGARDALGLSLSRVRRYARPSAAMLDHLRTAAEITPFAEDAFSGPLNHARSSRRGS